MIQEHPNVQRFLDLTAWSEGTSTSSITKNNGYDIIVSSILGPARFDDYSTHPFATGRVPQVIDHKKPATCSTASGRYQIILGTWRKLIFKVNRRDFSPDTQDMMAVELLKEARAYDLICNGEVTLGLFRARFIWASFPNNDYQQAGGRTLEALLNYYNSIPTINT